MKATNTYVPLVLFYTFESVDEILNPWPFK